MQHRWQRAFFLVILTLGAFSIGKQALAQTVTEFPIPTAGSLPSGITVGPDGALWFTESGSGKIGRITTSGVITEFPLPTPLASQTASRRVRTGRCGSRKASVASAA